MTEIVRAYHGSRGGLQGAIQPESDSSADFGSGFYMGDEITQPQTLICEAKEPVLYTLDFNLDGLIGVTALVKAMAAVNIGNQYCAKTAKACAQISVVGEKRFSPHECELLKDRCFHQRARGASEAERICKQNRREGESFDEILERLCAEGGVAQ